MSKIKNVVERVDNMTKMPRLKKVGKSTLKSFGCFVGAAAFTSLGKGLMKTGTDTLFSSETCATEKLVGGAAIGVGFANHMIGTGCVAAGVGYAIDAVDSIREGINNVLDNEEDEDINFDDIDVEVEGGEDA